MSVSEMRLFLNVAPDLIGGLLIMIVFLVVIAFKIYGKE